MARSGSEPPAGAYWWARASGPIPYTIAPNPRFQACAAGDDGGGSAGSSTSDEEEPRREPLSVLAALDVGRHLHEARRQGRDTAAKAGDDRKRGAGSDARHACPAAKNALQSGIENEDAPLRMPGEIKKPAQASSKPAEPPQVPKEEAPPEEIFAAVKEIPDLARADLLRAYSMFIRDDRRFRSLMALPKDMMKDWLLMEIENN